ncbi:hypothetical protein AVEN_147311-1 [Araneus ventricosus]|uniref:Uncharacterized protein n=1 Tax=Araneus ventricosus TaxID=182803 RepID=A0A4Y2KZ02_ARAVE|nr:hypothetical protein AVEN_147311-1 [Araneus ventricosus]
MLTAFPDVLQISFRCPCGHWWSICERVQENLSQTFLLTTIVTGRRYLRLILAWILIRRVSSRLSCVRFCAIFINVINPHLGTANNISAFYVDEYSS